MSFPLLSESRTRFLGHLSGESLPQVEVLELFGDFSIDLAGDSGAVSLCLGLVASEVQKRTHRSRASEPAVTGQYLLFPSVNQLPGQSPQVLVLSASTKMDRGMTSGDGHHHNSVPTLKERVASLKYRQSMGGVKTLDSALPGLWQEGVTFFCFLYHQVEVTT